MQRYTRQLTAEDLMGILRQAGVPPRLCSMKKLYLVNSQGIALSPSSVLFNYSVDADEENFKIMPPQSCHICKVCRVARKHMKACSACKVARYCSRQCQHADWRRHRAECIV